MGPTRKKGSRIIVAKMSSYKDREKIVTAARKQVPGNNEPFVSAHLPPEQLSARSMNKQIVENMKKTNPDDLKVRMTGTELFVNNDKIKPPVAKPTTLEVLNPNKTLLQRAQRLPQRSASTSLPSGFSFCSDVFQVKSVNDIRAAYLKTMTNPNRTGNHYILA